MSKKGYYHDTGYGIEWCDLWQPYKKICVCEDCAEKLFGIKSSATMTLEIINSINKHEIKPVDC